MTRDQVMFTINGGIDDAELSALHAAAFDAPVSERDWASRLAEHSLFWVTATLEGQLVGFVNLVGDGGEHAVVLDTCVAPDLQGRGIGRELVIRAAQEATRRGCSWLHADYEQRHVGFYEQGCGLRPTAAGLLALGGPEHGAEACSASRLLSAPRGRVWGLLADPAQHHRFDGTGMVGAPAAGVAGPGEVFRMNMTWRDGDHVEPYQSDNHVVAWEPGRTIAWATALPDGEPLGWSWRYDLDDADGGTAVRLTYDWSDTPPEHRRRFGVPLVDEGGLARSLDRLAEVAEAGPPEVFEDTATLAARVIAMAADGRRVVLGVAGAPGAGKSTLVAALVRAVDEQCPGAVAGVPMDGFHLAASVIAHDERAQRRGAPDTFDAAGYAELMERIRRDDEDEVYAPTFSREIEDPVAAAILVARQHRIVITEGNYLLEEGPQWRRARAAMDAVWFLDVDADLRRSRLLARHITAGKSPEHAEAFTFGSDEANARRIDATRSRADLVVVWDA